VKHLLVTAILSLATLTAPTLAQAQDADAGAKIFKRCAACHTINEGGAKKVGPNLWGVFGSTAGQRDIGYKFSKAMKDSGIVWNDETMSSYLENPKKFIPKNRMAFPGLKKEDDRKDLIAYLKSVTQ
jgi:cytochrome c